MVKLNKKNLGKLLATLAVIGTGVVAGTSGYSRSEFPHWSDQDGDCLDTRQEVLVRDADAPVTMSADGCTVVGGMWIDPYTGEQFTNPKDLDIDHLVALKNAWNSGASEWDKEKRKEYANYLGNDYHLIAVKASENRKKGYKAPDGYLPPKKDFQCQYADFWVKVKSQWELTITGSELSAIKKVCGI